MTTPNEETEDRNSLAWQDAHTKPFATQEEVEQCVLRFVNSHFRNHGKPHAIVSIPTDLNRDDDVRLLSHVRNQWRENEQLRTRLAELERIVEGPVKELWKRSTENGHVYCDTQAQPMYLTREACIAAQKGKS